MLITFSGLDGAGKTTLISSLVQELKEQGYRSNFLTMYGDISFYSFVRKIRDKLKNLLGLNSKNEIVCQWNINPQDPKVDVSDKKDPLSKFVYKIIRSQFIRKCSLCLDLLLLLFFRFKEETIKKNILITDRYLYDSLVDVVDLNWQKWFFIRFFMFFTPKPALPIFVDVPAETAYLRKKEYPLDYMKWRRETYLKIFGWVDNAFILENNDLERARSSLLRLFYEHN